MGKLNTNYKARRQLEKPEGAESCPGQSDPPCAGWLVYQSALDVDHCTHCGFTRRGCDAPEKPRPKKSHPDFWIKGQLLNVRNNGSRFTLTLLAEEFDPFHPERSMHFDDPIECQNFVSDWYTTDDSGNPFR